MKRGNIRGFTWVDRVGPMRMLIDLQFTKGAGAIRRLRGIGGQGLGSGVSTADGSILAAKGFVVYDEYHC